MLLQALRRSGPRALYYGMVPYCLESWPYDISELAVVGAAKDLRGSSSSSSSWSKAQIMQWDLATGAVGGTVAVLVSMPFDVVSETRSVICVPAVYIRDSRRCSRVPQQGF